MNYERKSNWTFGENKPNSNPNKANLKRAKIDVNICYTEVYENILCIRNQGKQSQFKPNLPEGKIEAKCVYTKDYEN